MQSENRIFDDFARLAGGAFSAVTGLKTEMEALFRQQFERMLGDMNLVSRDEFEAVQAMAAKARSEQDTLNERVAALEAQVAALQAGAEHPARRKAAPKE